MPSTDRIPGRPAGPTRRRLLAAGAGWALASVADPAAAAAHDASDAVAGVADADDRPVRLAAAWRGPRVDDPQQVGVLEVAPGADRVRVAAVVAVPSRAHGLTALPDGGFVAVAFRPGHWLMRLDAEGRPVAGHRLAADGLHFSGHVVADAAAGVFHATATDPATGAGWITTHDADRLTLLDRRPTGGIEPHQLLAMPDGGLVVAHGGIRRDADGRRLPGAALVASLDRLDPRSGRTLARWRLDDPSLSIRHLARSPAGDGTLGVALQAEHEDPLRRRDAPVLAVLDADGLAPWAHTGGLGGVAGDIAACDAGGFVLSQAAAGGAWWADGDAPPRVAARLREAGALATGTDGTWIAAAVGLACWHPSRPPRLLAWPRPMAPDNHLAVLASR